MDALFACAMAQAGRGCKHGSGFVLRQAMEGLLLGHRWQACLLNVARPHAVPCLFHVDGTTHTGEAVAGATGQVQQLRAEKPEGTL